MWTGPIGNLPNITVTCSPCVTVRADSQGWPLGEGSDGRGRAQTARLVGAPPREAPACKSSLDCLDCPEESRTSSTTRDPIPCKVRGEGGAQASQAIRITGRRWEAPRRALSQEPHWFGSSRHFGLARGSVETPGWEVRVGLRPPKPENEVWA